MEQRKRSKSYPGYNLADTIANVRTMVAKLGPGTHSREDISESIGSPKLTGGSARKISAMSSFGLIEKKGEGYSVTELARNLIIPLAGEEPMLLKAAFHSVPLYKEVFEAYKGETRLPVDMPVLMERKFGIASEVGSVAFRVLKESAISAGIMTSDGEIIDSASQELEEIDEPGDAPQPFKQPVAGTLKDFVESNPGRIIIELPRPSIVFTAPKALTRAEKDRVLSWIDKVLKPQFEFLVDEDFDQEVQL